MQPISEWLLSLGLTQYASVFEDNGIDLEALALLSDGELEKLGVLLGHRKKIFKALSVLSDSSTPPDPAPSPQQYTPTHLAEKILTTKSALEGERKQVTVLFADLKGSMELLADRDPEEARRILDPVLRHMMEAVHRYEGTVNQVMGDGIMALFGAPLSHEDHAVRACYAALRMQETVKHYAQEIRRTEAVSIQIRVGLNSGEVVVRAIGNDLHMDYTAVGQTTHLAARMEQLATPGSVMMTSDTLRFAEGYVQVSALGPINVKGLVEPVEVFELTGAGAARTRLQAAAMRGFTRFVGRDAEVEHLRRVLGQADAGRGQVVAIVGEAGVGKSRLTHEFTQSHRVQNWLVMQASSVSYGKATSYRPVIDLLKDYFKIGERDDHREMRDKVLGRVLGLDRALEPLMPALLALLEVPAEDASWRALDPSHRRQRTLDAVKRLLLSESQVQPLLVVFEDLHWIDGETQALLDSLVESLGSARMLLLVNYRPEFEHRWASKTVYSQIRLDALPAESVQELLTALLGDDPQLASLTRMLAKQGNPFFLEESVRTLVETGALMGERGAYRLTRTVETLQIPPTVQTLLAARIDRLPAEAKHVLQAASVIGKDVPYALLTAISTQPEESLRRALARLQEAEFIYETQLFPDLEYTFKHALTHEVAYGGLLQSRRKFLHTELVAEIERRYADRLVENVERLAHHALRGGLWEQAIRYSRQAGINVLERSAPREALAHFEQTRRALYELPQDQRRDEQLIDLCFLQRAALHPLGEFGRQGEVLSEARTLAQGIDDQRRLGRVLAYQANLHDFLGEHAQAIAVAQHARTVANAAGDVEMRVLANHYLGQARWYAGDLRQAIEPLRELIALTDGAPIGERYGLATLPRVAGRFWLVAALAELGEFVEARSEGEEGIRIASAAGHAHSETWVRFFFGYAHIRRGDFTQAVRVLEPGLVLCEKMGLQFALMATKAALGYSYLWSGRRSDALPLLEEAVDFMIAMRIFGFSTLLITWLAEAYLVHERIAQAHEWVMRASDLARAHQERAFEAWSLKLLGEIHARTPEDAGKAAGTYRQALVLANELGMRPLVAHCHLGLSRLPALNGQTEESQRERTLALNLYEELNMTLTA